MHAFMQVVDGVIPKGNGKWQRERIRGAQLGVDARADAANTNWWNEGMQEAPVENREVPNVRAGWSGSAPGDLFRLI
jgi:hypothetical protein